MRHRSFRIAAVMFGAILAAGSGMALGQDGPVIPGLDSLPATDPSVAPPLRPVSRSPYDGGQEPRIVRPQERDAGEHPPNPASNKNGLPPRQDLHSDRDDVFRDPVPQPTRSSLPPNPGSGAKMRSLDPRTASPNASSANNSRRGLQSDPRVVSRNPRDVSADKRDAGRELSRKTPAKQNVGVAQKNGPQDRQSLERGTAPTNRAMANPIKPLLPKPSMLGAPKKSAPTNTQRLRQQPNAGTR